MASTVQICNLALGIIGGGRITSLSDASEPARECNAIFELLRDEVLEAFPWTFARARVELAQDAAEPAFGYQFQYLLPADCLKPNSTLEGDSGPIVYVIEGAKLLTNESAISLRYTKRVTDPSLFPPSFVSCLAQRMAVPLAMNLRKDSKMSLTMFNVYEKMVKQYELTDARRDVLDTLDDTSYIDSRNND